MPVRRSPLFVIVLFVIGTLFALPLFAQQDQKLPQMGEGCLLYRAPLSGQYESIPLVHTDVVLDVRGLVAAATVTQQYANSTSQPVEAIYVFPLPHDSAVYDMEIRIGERVIHSVIKERAEAKRVYEQAKSEGHRAALVEEERPNIFTMSVANVMPGDHIDVRLRYVQPLPWEDGHMRIVFPMVVGPRYIPGSVGVGHSGTGWSKDTDDVPDASRITPPIRHPANRNGHDITLAVNLDPGFKVASLKSVSHTIVTREQSDGSQRVELSAEKTIPNKDFVLEVEQAASKAPQTSLFLSPADKGEAHFMLAAFPPTVQPTGRVPVEMLYVIDISGSMEGTSINQARRALLQALDRLAPTDRFGILWFNNSFGEFSAEPLQATTENLAAGRRYVSQLQAGGGTEMRPALVHVMTKPTTRGYVRNIVLLTDGDLGNEEQIFKALHEQLGDARLFTIGIGSAPNIFLATKMAQYGRGTFTHIADVSEVEQQMSRLFNTIEAPVLTDVKLTFEGVEVTDVYPQRAPDLFLRQPSLVFGRITKGSSGQVRLKGSANGQDYENKISFDISKASFHPGISTLWARQRVEELMDGWRRADEKDRAEIRSTIVAHAVRYKLVTRFTSLVAVEDIVVNPGGQSDKAAVPTELPAGWQLDKVAGPGATGTADEFLRVLGLALLLIGVVMHCLLRFKKATA